MDISIILPLKSLKSSIHVNETYSEGSLSQNVDIGLSIFFIGSRRWRNHFKISHVRNIDPCITCYMSLDEEKSKLLFDV